MFNVYLSLGIFVILIKMVKKKYSTSKKGKYYTYARLNKMLTQYSKVKLSSSLAFKWVDQASGGFLFRLDIDIGSSFPQCSLGLIYGACTSYEGLRNMYGAFKVRGMLIETFPFGSKDQYMDGAGNTVIPWNGMCAIGLFTDGGGATAQERLNNRRSYKQIVEADKGMVLDVGTRQRKYFYFNQYDFTAFPNAAYATNPPFVPLYLHSNYLDITVNNNYVTRPEWVIKITFYVTVKDKIM